MWYDIVCSRKKHFFSDFTLFYFSRIHHQSWSSKMLKSFLFFMLNWYIRKVSFIFIFELWLWILIGFSLYIWIFSLFIYFYIQIRFFLFKWHWEKVFRCIFQQENIIFFKVVCYSNIELKKMFFQLNYFLVTFYQKIPFIHLPSKWGVIDGLSFQDPYTRCQ